MFSLTEVPVANELNEQVKSLSIQGNSDHSPSGEDHEEEQNEQFDRTGEQENNKHLDDTDSGMDNHSVKDSPIVIDENDPGR